MTKGDSAKKDGMSIDLIVYDAKEIVEKQHVTLEECEKSQRRDSLTWINILGAFDPKKVQALGEHFELHPLIIQDILRNEERSKLNEFKNAIYIKLHILKYNQTTEDIEDNHLSLILGKNVLISFLEKDPSILDPVREQLRNPKSLVRSQGVDYLAYVLTDLIVDGYFKILEEIDGKLEDLEEKLIKRSGSNTIGKIQITKRKISHLRKVVWPLREAISRFQRIESPLVEETTKLYIQNIYDHTIQIIDTLEYFRDIISEMFDIYLSNINLRMNEIMKVLTIVATIFVPLTFIASLYGMNFDYIPGMHSRWGYYVSLAIMAAVALAMTLFFRKKKWI